MVTYSPVNNVIEINTQEYFKLYKDIIKTCIEDGYLLPGLLEVIDVPEKYDYSYEEKLKFKMSDEASNKRQQMQMERELKYGMVDVHLGDFKKWCEETTIIENDELLNFIATYPEFEKILK